MVYGKGVPFFLLYPIMFFSSLFSLTFGVAVVTYSSLSNSLFCFKKLYMVITGSQLPSLLGEIILLCLFFYFL